jgi:hypothetical protein
MASEVPRVGRTHKDGARQKTHRVTLEVLRNPDGTYEIFFNGEHARSSVPEQWLNEELCVRYGFCGAEYDSIIQDLREHGKAAVSY